jgi:hypothetical protein
MVFHVLAQNVPYFAAEDDTELQLERQFGAIVHTSWDLSPEWWGSRFSLNLGVFLGSEVLGVSKTSDLYLLPCGCGEDVGLMLYPLEERTIPTR